MEDMSILLFVVLWCVFVGSGCATNQLLLGTGEPIALAEAFNDIRPGEFVIVGETHGNSKHKAQQKQLIDALHKNGQLVSVGLEFFEYPYQDVVTAFQAGKIAEADFLKKIHWSGPAFEFYRDQVLQPRMDRGERVVALNCPREVTSAIAKNGLSQLSSEFREVLPPDFAVGRETYKSRFLKMVPHQIEGEAAEHYFEAQSAWDDTMAWQALKFLNDHSDQIVVVIVGEFHVQYGGGLPDRIRARGGKIGKTISLIDVDGMPPTEARLAAGVHVTWGPRADLVWISGGTARILTPAGNSQFARPNGRVQQRL